jgi:hypothetical protein
MLHQIPPLARFERSPITELLLARIRSMESGETVPYAELNEIAGDDVQNGVRHLLASARKIALREGIAVAAVTEVGMKRLDSKGALDVGGDHTTKRVRRQLKTGLRILATADPERLGVSDRRRLDMYRVHLGTLRLFTAPKMERKFIAAAEDASLPTMREIGEKAASLFATT